MRIVLTLITTIFIITQGLWPACSAPHLSKDVFIRDAEIEQGLKDFLTPIFKVAGQDPSRIKIMIFNSEEVNAAAGLDYTIMVNTGLFKVTENLGQLLGVLAHETGHIAGRHNERLISTYGSMQLPVLAAMVLAGAGAVASGNGEVMMAGVAGMDILDSMMMSYHRGHESAADQAAFKYFDKLGWSCDGFYEFMKILHRQEMLSAQHQFAYKRTHPFMIERLRLVERHVANSKYSNSSFPKDFQQKFDRMRVKIQAYTDHPDRVLHKYPSGDQSLIARYARSIAFHRKNDTKDAVREIDSLISEYPDDPYFLEFKGQMLFEIGRVRESYQWYRKAIEKMPENTLVMVQYAHVLLEQGNKNQDREALEILSKVERQEYESPFYWRLRATAYGRLGQQDMATLMLAEESLCYGDIEKAHRLAARAIKGLKNTDTTARQRAMDIQEIEIPEDS